MWRNSPERGTPFSPFYGYVTRAAQWMLRTVQRLFSMFPTGGPGVALLLLRVSVAAAVLLNGWHHHPGLPQWVLAALLALCATLCAGFLTPLAAIVALGLEVLLASSASAGGAAASLITILDAVALTLLGPGAYSTDARRFGRRTVELPPIK